MVNFFILFKESYSIYYDWDRSRSRKQNWIKKGSILLNGKICLPKEIIKHGTKITFLGENKNHNTMEINPLLLKVYPLLLRVYPLVFQIGQSLASAVSLPTGTLSYLI